MKRRKYLTIGDKRVSEGEYMSLDGSTGKVYIGKIPTVDATVSGDFAVVMGWGGRDPQPQGPHQRRYPARCRRRRGFRRRGASA